MQKVYFVRHAQPNYHNFNDKMRELTEKGLQDRLLVTKYLEDKKIGAVYSRPYKRAIDTVKDFADTHHMEVHTLEGFRERAIHEAWIANVDFKAFVQNQWSDFSYKLPDGGESLQEVQDRNIDALYTMLRQCPGINLTVGSHGTALSTIIRYFDPAFGYEDFEAIKRRMPWIVEFQFDDELRCVDIRYDKAKLFKED